jgi:hypothetical protein
MSIHDTTNVIVIRSDETMSCPYAGCDFSLEADYLQNNINHCLAHGAKLLHVGQESTPSSSKDEVFQNTLAVLSVS